MRRTRLFRPSAGVQLDEALRGQGAVCHAPQRPGGARLLAKLPLRDAAPGQQRAVVDHAMDASDDLHLEGGTHGRRGSNACGLARGRHVCPSLRGVFAF